MSDTSSEWRPGWDSLPQRQRLHAPLQPEDTSEQTWGCRYSNPVACGRNKMPKVCAFVRADSICMEPPRGWPSQYAKLLAEATGGPQPESAGRDQAATATVAPPR
jgi:hypothetical protein